MTIRTNNANVPLSMALWLADDDYDHDNDPYTISATKLLDPIKAIVLDLQNPNRVTTTDIQSVAASRIGTAMHDAIEASWRKPNLSERLQNLGLPKKVADKVIVDPTEQQVADGCIPVYMEIRSYKQVGKWNVSGKFDFIMNSKLEDFKSTGTYTYEKGTNDTKYPKQGSLYRWLNPAIITDDLMTICFFFTNWSAGMTYGDHYPNNKVMGKDYRLASIEETQTFVEQKLATIESLLTATQDTLPPCTREELWQGVGTYKYYAKLDAKRATKNFDNPAEAQQRLIKDGNKGKVVHVPDKATACIYCSVNTMCEQGKLNLLAPTN